MGPFYRLLTEEVVKPTPLPPEAFDVELAGCDEIYDHFHIKLALCFKDLLPGPALKQSLAKALSAFPMLSGRARRGGQGQAWVECKGQGVTVREQLMHVSKGKLQAGQTKPHLLGLCGGQWASGVNDPSSPLLTVTLTEVVYSEGFQCRPPILACTQSQDREGPLQREEGEALVRHGSDEGERGGPPIRFVIGISVSHSVCDGCALSVFLLQWILAQHPSAPLTSAENHRGPLLLEQWSPSYKADTPQAEEEEEEETKTPGRKGREEEEEEARARWREWQAQRLKRIFTHASSWRKAYVIGCLMMSAWQSVWVTLSFSHDELEGLKQDAMAPLLQDTAPGQGGGRWVSTSNALAAHLWPILSDAWLKGKTQGLCPLSVVINSRKALGLPLHFCGNAVTLQPVESPAPDTLTQRALQVRAACVVSKEGALADHSFMQQRHRAGAIGHVMHRCMRDVIMGRPGLVWDDVSTLLSQAATQSPGPGREEPELGFSGSAPIALDLQMADVPGMVFVLAPPPGQNLGGKEVRVMLPSHVAKTLASPRYQQRLHAYSRIHRQRTNGDDTA